MAHQPACRAERLQRRVRPRRRRRGSLAEQVRQEGLRVAAAGREEGGVEQAHALVEAEPQPRPLVQPARAGERGHAGGGGEAGAGEDQQRGGLAAGGQRSRDAAVALAAAAAALQAQGRRNGARGVARAGRGRGAGAAGRGRGGCSCCCSAYGRLLLAGRLSLKRQAARWRPGRGRGVQRHGSAAAEKGGLLRRNSCVPRPRTRLLCARKATGRGERGFRGTFFAISKHFKTFGQKNSETPRVPGLRSTSLTRVVHAGQPLRSSPPLAFRSPSQTRVWASGTSAVCASARSRRTDDGYASIVPHLRYRPGLDGQWL